MSRRRLTAAELDRVLAACAVRPHAVEELTGGTFNTAYRIRRHEHPDLVLKISPSPDTAIMSYEHGLVHAEATYYRAVEQTGWVPLPRLVHVDTDRTAIDGDLILMTHLPGRGWHDEHESIEPAQRSRLRRDLGRMVATSHQVTGTAFGYPRGPGTPSAPTWSAAFTAMFDAVCEDANRFAVELPVPPAELSAIVRSRRHLLDEITTPVLVHFDLWDGNILVSRQDGRPTISGLIDGERAFWGDPVADFVSLALLGDIERDTAFLTGYREIAGDLTFDDPTRQRLSLYRCYLYLIMLVECVPRSYPTAVRQWLVDAVAPCLVAEVAALRGRHGGVRRRGGR